MDARAAGAAALAAATGLLLLVYGRDPWIVAVGLGSLVFVLVVLGAVRVLGRELRPEDAPPRRHLVRHRGLLASGLVACGASCLLAAALVTRHAEDRWGVLYLLLAALMTAGIVAIRFAYHGLPASQG